METARCKAFYYAAETGSITKAAEVMVYTPSGVSQLIQALESELDLKLLYRDKKGVSLTEEGKRFLPIVQDIIQGEESMMQLSEECHGLSVGTVRIAAYSSIATHWLPAVIKEFQEAYPNIVVELMEGVRQEVSNWLLKRQADIAFMTYREPMPFEWIDLAEDPMLAVLNKSHPLAKAKKYPIKNCEQERFIMPAQGQDEDVNEMLENNNLSLNIVFKTQENFPAIAMIEQGLGMSIMNNLITKKLDYDVVKIPVDPPQHITFGIAIPSLRSASPAVKKFVDVAVKRLST